MPFKNVYKVFYKKSPKSGKQRNETKIENNNNFMLKMKNYIWENIQKWIAN